MALNPDIREKADRYLKEIQKQNIRIFKAYLFGSYAKGCENKDSDIDIAILSPDFSGNRFADSIRIIPLRRKIDDRIEPVTFKPDDFSETDPLAAEIKSNGIELK